MDTPTPTTNNSSGSLGSLSFSMGDTFRDEYFRLLGGLSGRKICFFTLCIKYVHICGPSITHVQLCCYLHYINYGVSFQYQSIPQFNWECSKYGNSVIGYTCVHTYMYMDYDFRQFGNLLWKLVLIEHGLLIMLTEQENKFPIHFI